MKRPPATAIGVSFSTPAFFSAIFATSSRSEHGVASGTASAALDLGLGIGPIALGLVAASAGIPWTFAAGAAVAFGGLDPRGERDAPAPVAASATGPARHPLDRRAGGEDISGQRVHQPAREGPIMAAIRVLELRIHGIANSPPADLLLSSREQIEQRDGDDAGSFWHVTPAEERRETDGDPGTAGPGATDPGPAGDPDAAGASGPAGAQVVTEAYSWGNQARSGGTALALIGRALVHIGWLLVLPFGLCNLAYWSRRNIVGEHERPEWWRAGDGAASVRVFALLQTLFYAVGLLTVSVYLIGMECFPGPATPGGPPRVCAALPDGFDALADWSVDQRSALLGIVPIAVILFIYVLSRRARAGFHPETSFDDERLPHREPTESDAADPPRPPLLASTGFWQRARIAQTSERTHLAAVIAFVLTMLVSDAVLDATGGRLADTLGSLPEAAALAPMAVAMSIVGLVLLAATFVLAGAASMSGKLVGTRLKRGIATGVLCSAVLAYLVWWAWVVFGDGSAPTTSGDGINGLIIVPTAIAAIGALIAVMSLSWGYGPGVRIANAALVVLALACLGVAEVVFAPQAGEAPEPARMWLSIGAAVLILLAIAVSYLPLRDPVHRARARVAGWHGNGAAVSLLLAWFASLVITSLLVLGAHAWLSGSAETPEVTGHLRTSPASPGDGAAAIAAPVFYERFAGMLVVILIALLIVAGVGAVAALHRFTAYSLPGLMFSRSLSRASLARQREHDAYLGGTRHLVAHPHARSRHAREVPWQEYPPAESKPSGRLRSIADARRIASLAHRGEPVLRALAVLTAAALLLLGIPALGQILDGGSAYAGEAGSGALGIVSEAWGTLSALGGWALGLLALATVAWVVMNAVTSTERPLGLAWDIICFFPRAGHPFTPPCYAERAVPEVAKRVTDFIAEEKAAGREPYVILSAHSMGATIAVAALFALHRDAQDAAGLPVDDIEHGRGSPLDRVALLTHGVQLRAYFSRFFPEVFGPRVLGIHGTAGPSLVRSDPWTRQVVDDYRHSGDPVAEPTDVTIVRLLGGDLAASPRGRAPRWRSLWRRTDYLGFPVFGYWSHADDGINENPIDRGAAERCPRSYLWKIARHNDYLSTHQYQEAREELIGELIG